MIHWLGIDNQYYLDALYKLETAKADLELLRSSLRRVLESKRCAQENIRRLNDTLEYLNKFAPAVSMKEWRRMTQYKAGELELFLNAKAQIEPYQKQIKALEGKIVGLEKLLPTLKSKVLRFNQHD